MGMALVAVQQGSGYQGPPELTLQRAFTEWTLDPVALAFVLLLAGLYLSGVRRARRSGTPWPAGRIVAFCGLGLGFLVIATMSWVGVYQAVLFYARAVQTILLLLAVPLFLAMGRPVTLAIAALPRLGPRIEAGIRTQVAKVLTFPAVTTLVLIVVPFLVYFTPWYEAGFHSVVVRNLTHLALMVPGFVFFWTLLRVDPVPKAYPYLVSLWVTGAEVVGDAVLGLAVIADQNLIAGAYYHALARPWGPSVATDQVLGGGTLWILGDIVGLPFLAVQLIQMIREDEAEAVAVDAELDARDAARAATVPSGQDGGQHRRSQHRRSQHRRSQHRRSQHRQRHHRRWAARPAPPTTGHGGNLTRGSSAGSSPSTTAASNARSVAAADQERPALTGQAGRHDEFLGLEPAPRGHVGLRRRVVGQHRYDVADRHLPDPLGQHDDGDRALPAQGVDGQRGRRRIGLGCGARRGCGLRGGGPPVGGRLRGGHAVYLHLGPAVQYAAAGAVPSLSQPPAGPGSGAGFLRRAALQRYPGAAVRKHRFPSLTCVSTPAGRAGDARERLWRGYP